MLLPAGISLVLLLVISFFTLQKRTHPFVFIFTLFVLEYSFTSYISVIVDDGKLWEIKKTAKDFILFRMAEVVVFPILLLFLTEVVNLTKRIWSKLLLAASWIGLLLGIELCLEYLQVMDYKQWAIWMSAIAWLFFVSLTFISQLIFKKILFKEGIHP